MTNKSESNGTARQQITLVLPEEQMARIEAHAAARGETVEGFLCRAIGEAIECDNIAARAMKMRLLKS